MPINPIEIENDQHFSYDLLAKMNLKPRYLYKASVGLNSVTIPIPLKTRKNAMLTYLIAMLAMAAWKAGEVHKVE